MACETTQRGGGAPSSCLLLASLAFLCLCPRDAAGHIFGLKVRADQRRVMDLGVFGFSHRGTLELEVKGLELLDKDAEKTTKHVGFTLDRVSTALTARREKNYGKGAAAEKGLCFIYDEAVMQAKHASSLDWRLKFPLETELARQAPLSISFPPIQVKTPGLYALFFYNCKKFANETDDGRRRSKRRDVSGPAEAPPPRVPVSFEVKVKQYNMDGYGELYYSSYGKRFLAEMLLFFCVCFVGLLGLWLRELLMHKEKVHRIHHLMTILLVFKILTLFFQAMKDLMARSTGRPSPWSYLYYIFLTLRGIMLFSIIMLIGTGWSFVRPYLSERDKKLVALVLPLQVIIHVVVAVIDETSEGDASYSSWVETLLFLDIVCCCVVILPTIWNIKQITETKSIDGKESQALTRLKQFRTFYVIVCVYIYFTRLAVPFIETWMPYNLTWVAPALSEVAASLFYFFSGMKFRPSHDNGTPSLSSKNADLEAGIAPELRKRTDVDNGMLSTDSLPMITTTPSGQPLTPLRRPSQSHPASPTKRRVSMVQGQSPVLSPARWASASEPSFATAGDVSRGESPVPEADKHPLLHGEKSA